MDNSIVPKNIINYYRQRYAEVMPWSSENYYNFLLNLLGNVADKKVLDLGFGYGEMLKGIIRNQGKAYGLEIAKGAFDFVKKTVPQAVIKLAPAENIPFDDSFFDICICSGTLEHFVDISKGLKEIRRVLKKNGFLIVVVPNRNWIGKLYDWSGINYLHTVVRHTLPDQLIERELCLSQWINLLNQNNFSVEGWQPWNTSIRAPIFNLIIIKPSYVKPALCFHFIIKAAKTDS